MDPMTIAMLAQAGYGLYRGIKAQQGMRALQKQRMPSLMESAGPLQENRRLYEQQFRQGLTPATRTMAQQQFAAGQLAQQRAATDLSGGQMSSALSRMNAANTGQFALGLAAQNEAAQRAGMAGMIGANQAISGLQRADAAQRLAQRQQMEQAYGQAMQQGFQDVLGAAGGFAMGKMQASEAEKQRQLMRDIYGGGKVAPSTTNAGFLPLKGQSIRPSNVSQPNALTPRGPIGVNINQPIFNSGTDAMNALGPEFVPTTSLPAGLGWGTPSSSVPSVESMGLPSDFESIMGRTPGMYQMGSSELSIPGAPTIPNRSFPSLSSAPSNNLMSMIGRYPGEDYRYDLGLPPLRTRYSTPRTTFR